MDSLKKSAYALLAEYELVDVLEMVHLLISQEQFRRDTTADHARNPRCRYGAGKIDGDDRGC